MIAKLNFQQPLLQSSGNRDPSEIVLKKKKVMSTDYYTVIPLKKSSWLYTDQLEDITTMCLKQKTLEVIIAAASYPINKTCQSQTDKTNLSVLDSWIIQQSANYNETYNSLLDTFLCALHFSGSMTSCRHGGLRLRLPLRGTPEPRPLQGNCLWAWWVTNVLCHVVWQCLFAVSSLINLPGVSCLLSHYIPVLKHSLVGYIHCEKKKKKVIIHLGVQQLVTEGYWPKWQ